MKHFLTILLVLSVAGLFAFTAAELELRDNATAEHTPLQTHAASSQPVDELYDLQFQFPVGVGGGEAGIETDGNYIYTTKWNGGSVFYQYQLDGTYVGEITCGAATAIRDLAYDGTYFYGGAATTTVYEMDFTNQVVISTITAPTACRAIAYDPDADGFWANNWSTDITLFDRNGNTINSFVVGAMGSFYGLAWEDVLPDGPFLWGASQDGNGNELVKMDIAAGGTQVETYDIANSGITYAAGEIAGGLYIADGLVAGKWTIGGIVQNVTIWGLELGDAADPAAPAAPSDFAVVPDASGALSATVAWTAPSLQVNGDPLTDLDEMRLYRDGVLIYTDSNPTVGGAATYVDAAVPASGTYEYGLVGYNDAGEGLMVTTSCWVGEDVPAAVTDLTLVQTAPGVLSATLTWVNPTEGMHGGPFNQPIVGYHLTRSDGVVLEVAGETTTYVDNTIPASGTYGYEVVAYNTVGDGAAAMSNYTLIADSGLIVEDFEATNGGYTTGGTANCWEWGIPNYPEGPATAHSGNNCWATGLTGPFLNSSQCYLQTTPIALSSGNAFFSFYHWYDFGPSNWDGGNLKISTDNGSTWELIYPDGGYPTDELASSNPLNPEPGYCGEPGLGWVEAMFDLSTYAGQEVVIKFDFGSSSVVEHPGWYIDDVMYATESGDPGYITGNVMLDGGSGNVEDVVVTAGAATTNPDANGDYELTVMPGTYIVSATLAGYEPATQTDVVVTEGQTTSGVDLTLVAIPPVLLPPADVAVDENTGLVTWNEPGSGGGILAYHTGYDANGIGTGAAVDFSCAARFTADELTDYYGMPINAVRFVIHSADFTQVMAKVWEGGSYGDPGTEVYSADVTGSIVVGDWTEHMLTTPVTLVAGNEYWVGYEISASGDHPAAVDAGPMVPEKGAWMLYNGSWSLLPDLGATLDFNWCIEGVVGSGADMVAPIVQTYKPQYPAPASRTNGALSSVHAGSGYQVDVTRDLMGYNIYLDGSLIASNIVDTQYQLVNLIYGQTYVVGVSAVYDEGESDVIEVSFVYMGDEAGPNGVVAITALGGNYPNPFNPETDIFYETGRCSED
jgi:hypothetical protein